MCTRGISTTLAIGSIVVLALILGIVYFAVWQNDEDLAHDAVPVLENTNSFTATDDAEQTLIEYIFSHPDREVTTLDAVSGATGSGTAYRVIDETGLSHAVVADMPDPTGVNQYEGWLVLPGTGTFVSTGVMEKQDNGTWQLEYTGDISYDAYTSVVITEETVIDDTPETHILEGSF